MYISQTGNCIFFFVQRVNWITGEQIKHERKTAKQLRVALNWLLHGQWAPLSIWKGTGLGHLGRVQRTVWFNDGGMRPAAHRSRCPPPLVGVEWSRVAYCAFKVLVGYPASWSQTPLINLQLSTAVKRRHRKLKKLIKSPFKCLHRLNS